MTVLALHDGESPVGTRALVQFQVRRQAVSIAVWAAAIGLLVGYQSWGSQSFYGSEAALTGLRRTMGDNAAVVAMSGPRELLDTIGGEVVFEIFSYVAVAVSVMVIFVVTRVTRAEEDSGRAELIASLPVGRHVAVGAALVSASVALTAVAVTVTAAAVITGLPWVGSIVFGASVVGVGVVVAGITAVAVQVLDNAAQARGAVFLVVVLAYAVRAVGDVTGHGISWFSPIGWGHRTFPFVENRWWPLALPLVAGAVLAVVATALADRRDLGGGMMPLRRGPTTAAPYLRSMFGLALRLRRGLVLAWAAGVFTLGAAYGSFADSIDDFLADNPDVAAYLPGGGDAALDSYLAVTLTLAALLASAHGVVSVLRAVHEEEGGLLDAPLAEPVGRTAAVAATAAVAVGGSAVVLGAGGLGEGLAYGWTTGDASTIPTVTVAALCYLPAVSIMVAVAVLAFGVSRRWASAVAWSVFAYVAVVTVFAESFRLPTPTRTASPFEHLPRVPLDAVNVPSMATMVAVAVLTAAVGAAAFSVRDVGRS